MKKTVQQIPLFLILVWTMGWIMAFILPSGNAAAETSWDEVMRRARGQTVDWHMWGGFPSTNAYVNGYVASQVKDRFGIHLRQVPVTDIAEVIGKLLVEKQAGKHTGGKADLLWINGENFRTAKRHGLLFGPFAHRLPNDTYVDWTKASVKNDFGEKVEGMESPWGSAQVVMIYDTRRTPKPPETLADLLSWVRSHPGRFSYPAPPDFTGSVFVRHVFYHAAGDAALWQGSWTEEQFRKAASETFRLLKELRPFLWREGKTYPENPERLSQLFVDAEIDFAISYHPAEASKKISDGLYPDSVRTFVFKEGTIRNTHFLAIPFNAQDKEGAMVTADFLLSPEAQLKKADPRVWGDFPAIDLQKLAAVWRKKFQELPRGEATLPNAVLQSRQLPEPPSEILIRLEKGWETHVLKGR